MSLCIRRVSDIGTWTSPQIGREGSESDQRMPLTKKLESSVKIHFPIEMAPFARLRIAPGANNAIMGSLITLSKYHSICDDDDNDDDDDDDDDEQDVLL